MTYQRIKALIESLTIERLFLLLFFISASVVIQGYGPDVYLHLTTGRYILELGGLSHIDVFSFTRYGEPWVMHEWLYQIIFYVTHKAFGVVGLQVIAGGVITTTLYINKKNCVLLGASNVTAWIATMIFFLTWLQFAGDRPHIFTYLFFSLSLYFILLYRYRERSRPLYIIPVVMVAWVNIHGAFIVGIILLGYFTFITFVENYIETQRWRMPRHLFNSFTLSVIASLVNPYGIEQLLFPFRLMNQWAMKFVPEWMPPDLTTWNYALYAVIVAVFIFTTIWVKTEKKRFNLLFVAPFVIASFNSVRHIPIAAFILLPYFAANISALISSHSNWKPSLAASANTDTDNTFKRIAKTELGIIENILNWVLFFLFCSIMYLTNPIIVQRKANNFNLQFPVAATEFLINNSIHGRLFTTMQYSDYILFHRYPEQKIFYDVRIETYGRDLTFDYMKMANAQANWEELFRKYKIDYVVIDKVQSPYTAFIKSTNFNTLYEDEYSIIFTHTTHLSEES